MQEKRGPLHPADDLSELNKLVSKYGTRAGPTFEVGEIVVLKNYRYRIEAITGEGLGLVPHSPVTKKRRRKAKKKSGRRRGQR